MMSCVFKYKIDFVASFLRVWHATLLIMFECIQYSSSSEITYLLLLEETNCINENTVEGIFIIVRYFENCVLKNDIKLYL